MYSANDREINDRSDVYSLGVVAWELLTELKPWVGNQKEQLSREMIERSMSKLHSMSLLRLFAMPRSVLSNKRDDRPTIVAVVKALREPGLEHGKPIFPSNGKLNFSESKKRQRP